MDIRTSIVLRREPGPLARSLAALLLRIGLGLIFLTAGLSKFQAIKKGAYPGFILDQFKDKGLPGLDLFARVLPYAEVGLGAALIAGLFTTLAATLAGALVLVLLFGHTVSQKADMYPMMLIYLLVDAGIVWLSPVVSNYLSLDGLLFGWFWAPRSEGEYQRREEEVEKGRRV